MSVRDLCGKVIRKHQCFVGYLPYLRSTQHYIWTFWRPTYKQRTNYLDASRVAEVMRIKTRISPVSDLYIFLDFNDIKLDDRLSYGI